MAFQGVNSGNLMSSISNMNAAGVDLHEDIVNLSNSFAKELAGVWGNEKGVVFAKEFQETMNELASKTNSAFENINSVMNSVGERWCSDNGNNSFSRVEYSGVFTTVDASSIQNNIGGNEGMDPDAVTSITTNFCNNFLNNTNNDIQKAKSAASSYESLIGGSQQTNLNASIDSLASSINEKITGLSSDVSDITGKNVEVNIKAEADVSAAVSGQ